MTVPPNAAFNGFASGGRIICVMTTIDSFGVLGGKLWSIGMSPSCQLNFSTNERTTASADAL
jgi:hypothetical protein